MKYDGDMAEARGGFVIARSAQSHETVVISADYPYRFQAPEVSTVFADDPEGTRTMSVPDALTKAHSLGEPLVRKEFFTHAGEVEVLSVGASMLVTYRLEENDARAKSHIFTFANAKSGSLLDGDDTLDVDFLLASRMSTDTDWTRSFRGPAGRRGQTIQFRISSNDITKGYVVRRLRLEFDYLNQGQVGVGEV